YMVAVDQSDSIPASARAWAQRWLEELARSISPEDEIGVLTFAGDVSILSAPSPAASVPEIREAPVPTATDLSRALDAAMGLCPPDGHAGLVLLADGQETRGESRQLLPRLRTTHTRVDVLIPPADVGPDLAVEKLAAPVLVSEDQIFPLRVVLSNSGKPR